MSTGHVSTGIMSKINSETNLAVQLLLAVSDENRTKKTNKSSHSNSISSTEREHVDTGEETDSTDCAISAIASPDLQTKQERVMVTSTVKSVNDINISKNNTNGLKYSREERLEALQRFREKKRRRQFSKKVRYMVRKRLAETRPRYKGRFSKPPPGENYDDGTPGPSSSQKNDINKQTIRTNINKVSVKE